MKVSNGSKKRCRAKFNYKGIGCAINSMSRLLEDLETNEVVAEFIYDYSNELDYNVLLFLLLENCKDEKILNELKKFKYTI